MTNQGPAVEEGAAAAYQVLLVGHHDRAEAGALAATLARWLHERGHRAWAPATDAHALSLRHLADDRPPSSADLAISLGGDGTVLRTVKMLDGAPVPIIGVNVGLLGYLTELEPPVVEAALERWLLGPREGRWRVEERMMLDVVAQRTGQRWRALNEGVIEKRDSGHTVRLLVHIDGAPFTSYAADGLILATPTGSTAYSLSARGPVISPRHRAMLVTPVSPHMLFDRSLVLDPDEVVAVEVIGTRSAALSIDGQLAGALAEGDVITVRPSQEVARFVRFGDRHFHQILKAKFGLSDR